MRIVIIENYFIHYNYDSVKFQIDDGLSNRTYRMHMNKTNIGAIENIFNELFIRYLHNDFKGRL